MVLLDPLLFGTSAAAIDVSFLESELEDADTDSSLAKHWRTACAVLIGYVERRHPALRIPPGTREDLERSLPSALVSPWVARYGQARGLALRLIASLRHDLAPQVPALLPPNDALEPAEQLWGGRDDWGTRLTRLEAATLQAEESAVSRVKQVFGLTDAEMARLFGVSRQAVGQWREFPARLRDKAAAVVSIADLLDYRLKPGRAALVARRPAAAYGGLTMLDLIAADRHEDLFELTRQSFELAATA
jgi:hypothetical protein